MRRRNVTSRNRALRMEQLDRRCLLAGDCTVAFDGEELEIQCDSEDNVVSVSTDFFTGDLVVAGLGTTINGSPFPLNLGSPNDLEDVEVEMGDGNDTLVITLITVSGEIEVDLGDGDDTLIAGGLFAEEIEIDAGAGNDDVGLLEVTAEDEIEIDGGSGEDLVSAVFLTAEEIELDGGDDDDILFIRPDTIMGDLEIDDFELVTQVPPI